MLELVCGFARFTGVLALLAGFAFVYFLVGTIGRGGVRKEKQRSVVIFPELEMCNSL